MSLFHAGIIPALDTDGNPINGAVWQFTTTGTTTAEAVYSDSDLSTSLGSTVESDPAGRFQDIYLDDSVTYRARLWPDDTLTGSPIKDIDPINSGTASNPGDGFIHVASFGAVGNATAVSLGTDDRAAVQAAFDYAATNGGRVRFGPSLGYRINNFTTGPWAGTDPAIVVPEGIKEIDFGGSTIYLAQGSGGFRAGGQYTANITAQQPGDAAPENAAISSEITEDLSVGEVAIDLVAGGGDIWSEGDYGFAQLGEFSFDLPEPQIKPHFRVVDVTGDTVTIDNPVTEAITIAGMTYGKFLHRWPLFEDLYVHDGVFDIQVGSTYYESNFCLWHGIRPRFVNIVSRNGGVGNCVTQQCVNATWINCLSENHNYFPLASYSRGYSCAETKNAVFINCSARGCRRMIYAEADSNVTMYSPHFENTGIDTATGLPLAAGLVTVFGASGKTNLSIVNGTIEGYGGFALDDWQSQTGETYRSMINFSGVTRMNLTADPGLMRVRGLSGKLDITVAGTREVYNFDRLVTWERTFELKNGMNLTTYGPTGIAVDVDVYTTPGLSALMPGSFTGFYFGDSANANNNAMTTTGITTGDIDGQAGKVISLQHLAGYSPMLEGRTLRKRVTIVTASGTDLDTVGEKVTVRALIARKMPLDSLELVRDAWTEAEWLRRAGIGGQTYSAQFTGTDLPNIVTLTTHTLNVAIADMAVGDHIESAVLSIALGGLEITGYEAKAGTADIFIRNNTGADINLGSGTLTVKWSKKDLGA